jgi:AraC-like DNA-binding protein
MARLLSFHEDAARLAKNAPDRLAHPEVARALEEALAHAMIRCLTESTAIEMDSRERSHVTVISKLEEFLAANRSEPIYLREICGAAGVSETTLRRCCHDHLGMGPVHYLWLRRMHLARVALLRADAATATVTGIATDHGFWKLGRFSVEYRKLFGELPSASLRRPPAARCIAQNRPFDLPVADFA